MANPLMNTGMATSNPQANISGIQQGQWQQANNQVSQIGGQSSVSPITIPIQIVPQQGLNQNVGNVQTNANLQATQQQQNVGVANNQVQAPSPQVYKGSQNTNAPINFDQIYAGYQSQYGNTYGNGVQKTSSIGTPIVTPIADLSTVEGQYQGQYAGAINQLVSQIITQTEGLNPDNWNYDPSKDNSLRVASEYAANSAMEQMSARGILNSSMTSERVAKVVSDLIPQYEKLAYEKKTQYLSYLTNTAQMLMSLDNQQFQYWKDAKERKFEQEKFEYEKEQDKIANAMKKVDLLGVVDNETATILGIPAGTPSWEAKKLASQQQHERQLTYDKIQWQYGVDVALAELKQEFTKETMALEHQYTIAEQNNNAANQRINATHESGLAHARDIANSIIEMNNYEKKSQINTNSEKEIAEFKNRWTEYDEDTHKYTINDNRAAYEYIKTENQAGRMSANDAQALLSKYNILPPANVQRHGNLLIIQTSKGLATFNVTKDTKTKDLIEWGRRNGVDISGQV